MRWRAISARIQTFLASGWLEWCVADTINHELASRKTRSAYNVWAHDVIAGHAVIPIDRLLKWHREFLALLRAGVLGLWRAQISCFSSFVDKDYLLTCCPICDIVKLSRAWINVDSRDNVRVVGIFPEFVTICNCMQMRCVNNVRRWTCIYGLICISVMTSGHRILFGACGHQRNEPVSYKHDQECLTKLLYWTTCCVNKYVSKSIYKVHDKTKSHNAPWSLSTKQYCFELSLESPELHLKS